MARDRYGSEPENRDRNTDGRAGSPGGREVDVDLNGDSIASGGYGGNMGPYPTAPPPSGRTPTPLPQSGVRTTPTASTVAPQDFWSTFRPTTQANIGGYNPNQYMSGGSAQQLAGQLGARNTRTQVFGAGGPPPQELLDFGDSGQQYNAGLVGQMFQNAGPAAAQQRLNDERALVNNPQQLVNNVLPQTGRGALPAGPHVQGAQPEGGYDGRPAPQTPPPINPAPAPAQPHQIFSQPYQGGFNPYMQGPQSNPAMGGGGSEGGYSGYRSGGGGLGSGMGSGFNPGLLGSSGSGQGNSVGNGFQRRPRFNQNGIFHGAGSTPQGYRPYSNNNFYPRFQ